MSTDEYVPSGAKVRHAYVVIESRSDVLAARAEFDRFLARVRRDAEAELDSWMARAYEAEKRAWQAEARIKAVEDVLDAAEDGQSTDPVTRTMYPRMINTAETRHALGTVTTPRT